MFSEIKNKVVRYLVIIVYIGVIFICALELNFLGMFGYSPNKQDIQNPIQQVASEVFTADSVLIGRYFKEDRTPVAYEEIAPSIIDALIATEDIRFYKHHGVDFRALLSSVVSAAQGDARGGSTITQQLAKNLYRTRYSQSLGWLNKIPGVRVFVVKMKEWATAYKLESNYEKEEILTMYLNTVSFGNNAFGITSASQRYFNKLPDAIEPEEAAVLIGMLKGTTLYNPFRNPERSLERRNVVLSQMNKAGFLSDSSFNTVRNLPLELHPGDPNTLSNHDSYLRAAVEKWLEDWSESSGYDIYTDGLKIFTAVDSRMQALAEETMVEQLKILQARLEQSWAGEIPWRDSEGQVIPDFLENLAKSTHAYAVLDQKYDGDQDSIFHYLKQKKTMQVFGWDGVSEVEYSTLDSLAHYAKMLNMGMMSMDPYDGSIKVWVGGINHNYYKFDHVMQAKRQPGSTFKTFTYLAALESGMSPCDKFVDRYVKINYVENGEDKSWEPKNADWVFSGREMSLRWAMGKSVNSITAQLTEKVGWDKVAEAANRSGIKSQLAEVPSIGLGSSDVSVMEMVNAYATFMNQGRKVEPRLVTTIVDAEGKVIFTSQTKSEQVVDPEVAWLMTYMLRGGIDEPEGTSQALWAWDLWKNGNQIGGKTGTSSDYVDGWYMGITKDLVTGIWVGCDERSIHFRNSATGEASRTALPIFGSFMEKVYHDQSLGYTYGPFPDPEVEILRSYNCPSPRVAKPDPDSSDYLLAPPPMTIPIYENNVIL